MDNHHLCSILLNLQDRLTNDDRKRLDLYLKNDVPKPIGEDLTLNGILKLIQSFFDQDNINEKDFTLLIDAFKHIRCFDAVNLLEEHQRGMLPRGLNKSPQNLVLIMPSRIYGFLYKHEYEYIDATKKPIENEGDYDTITDNYGSIIDDSDTNVREDEQTKLSSQKAYFSVPLLWKRCFVLLLILFILTLGILIALLIEGNHPCPRNR